MKETFKLTIDAESTQEGIIQCETKAEVACTEQMAISIIVNLMNNNEDMREIIYQAVFMHMADIQMIRRVDDNNSSIEPDLNN